MNDYYTQDESSVNFFPRENAHCSDSINRGTNFGIGRGDLRYFISLFFLFLVDDRRFFFSFFPPFFLCVTWNSFDRRLTDATKRRRDSEKVDQSGSIPEEETPFQPLRFVVGRVDEGRNVGLVAEFVRPALLLPSRSSVLLPAQVPILSMLVRAYRVIEPISDVLVVPVRRIVPLAGNEPLRRVPGLNHVPHGQPLPPSRPPRVFKTLAPFSGRGVCFNKKEIELTIHLSKLRDEY